MPTLADVRNLLAVFTEKYPRPWVGNLQISPLYDLVEHWPAEYPNSRKPGLYFLLNDKQELVYVGKASFFNNIGSRLGERIGYDPDRRARIKDSAWLSAGVRYIATIGLGSEYAFEAAAIEEFLVTKIDPCPILNKVGSWRPSVSIVPPSAL